MLFSIYAEIMVKEALNGVEEEIKVGGRMVNEDRFADDQGMVANTLQINCRITGNNGQVSDNRKDV